MLGANRVMRLGVWHGCEVLGERDRLSTARRRDDECDRPVRGEGDGIADAHAVEHAHAFFEKRSLLLPNQDFADNV